METPNYIAEALALACDTKELRIGPRALVETPTVFRHCFGEVAPIIIADTHTFAAAGRQTLEAFESAGMKPVASFIMDDPYAGIEDVLRVQERIARLTCIAVAVGSGTINDLVKLASSRCERPYLAVATAASMDGYTAYGASITADGSKQTFFCPAPKAVVADLEVIAAAPARLNAAGYADLAAKITAGADWILADALGQEAIEAKGWQMVHARLRHWLADPDGVRNGNSDALRSLLEGLLMTGFAMQHCRSSRPASGAEHQFSHLWDMQHHTHEGETPLHGCKVAIGTLAVTRLYEQLLAEPIDKLNIEKALDQWLTRGQLTQKVNALLPAPELNVVAQTESQAKYLDRTAMVKHLEHLRQVWPALKPRLQQQLIPSTQLADMLRRAGAPCESSQIGITRERLQHSYYEAQLIRRRFTALDLAEWTGLLPQCLDKIFNPS
jgi:glycerol-1-phosphate dehydrogenase [NAD(P)+]